MSGRSAGAESGFTLVEIVIAVAIVATTIAAGFGISLASRSLAVSTAAGEFDQFLDSARTMARDLDGATLAFTADAYGDGTEVRLFAGGPNGPPAPTTLPTLHARAMIEEAESLGTTPFAFIVHANGSLSGRPNYRIGDTTTNDVGCPASGAFHFVIKAAGGSADRYVPCRIKLAANGPVTLMAWPLASAAPSPTPCSSAPGCNATSLPSAPASTPSCPPNYTAILGGCAPVPPPPATGARYHVTITGAPATIAVGATGSFTAQATLMNPNDVAPGTPVSLPLSVQSADATCSAGPQGLQQSGSVFYLAGLVAGTCAVTVNADATGVTGASSDAATVRITVAGAPAPTPVASAASCDLAANGKCYHRIVGETNQTFWKYVFPDSSCSVDSGLCFYSDSIRQIALEPAYGFRPPTAAVDPAHEILFSVEKITSVLNRCQPYSYFAGVPAGDSIQWGGSSVGSPTIAPLGWGQPSVYSTVNHIVTSAAQGGGFVEVDQSWTSGTTLSNLFGAVASGQIGSAYTFRFFSSGDVPDEYVQWYPDFAGCDAAGDPNRPGVEYGISGVSLVFQIYQAVP